MLAAHDLGYLTTDRLLHAWMPTLRTVESLERYQGHLLNWYDTATRAPLHPRYVSTVDSGNLAGALLTLAQGLQDLESRPQTVTQRLEGLADTVAVLRMVSSSDGGIGEPRGRGRRSTAWRAPSPPRPADALHGPRVSHAPGIRAASGGRRSRRSIGWNRTRRSRRGRLLVACRAGRAERSGARARRRAGRAPRPSPHACVPSCDEMRFDFLYDRRRRIFAIGYRLADADGPGRLDRVFYDLLASEARLASFIAIAKGDVPQQHWFHLGRLVTNVDGRAALISWGGTMFEYLMPQLLMRSFAGTLLDQSCRAAVRRQIDYGRQRGVPWGVSESAYAFTDREGTYQYRAFGVPGLGLRRGLVTDLVIAPYATALASQVSPAMAVENFDRSVRGGAGGALRVLRVGGLQPARPGRRRACRNTPVRPVDRPRLLLPPPGDVAGGARQRRLPGRVRRPVPRRSAACRPRSCCSRSGCRARRSCRSRGRSRPPRRRRRCRCSRHAGSCRRRAPPSTRTSSRTGATPRR